MATFIRGVNLREFADGLVTHERRIYDFHGLLITLGMFEGETGVMTSHEIRTLVRILESRPRLPFGSPATSFVAYIATAENGT